MATENLIDKEYLNISAVSKVNYSVDSVKTFQGRYKVTFNDGTISEVPHNEENRFYKAIVQWVAAGNTIEDTLEAEITP